MSAINYIFLFFRSQIVFLSILLLFSAVPYYFLSIYLSKIPYTQYIFLIGIIFIKLFVLNEKVLKKRYTPIAQSHLSKELKRNPSSIEIYNRVEFYVLSRNISLALGALSVIVIGIVFQRF